MFQKIISLSIQNKAIVLLFTAIMAAAGIYSLQKIPLDAVPDITNNQVQIVTSTPSLAAEEVEKFITYPIEMAMANLPGRLEVRSISRYGLSVVTVVFDDDVPMMLARQYASEQLLIARENIPAGLGDPELMPITTGLGEVYQYVLTVDEKHRHLYNLMDLRTMHDWLIKKQLFGIEGVVEVSSFGGYLKQYEVSINPGRMHALGISIEQIADALRANNANTGGGYVEQGSQALYIRTQGLIENLAQLERIPVAERQGTSVLISDVATVKYAPALRYGAMTMDGKGEAVGGITLMLRGANSYQVVQNIKARIDDIQQSLPPGVKIETYLDRSALIDKTIHTASTNLIEGGIIVILILILLLGDFRASMLVASIIPLAMLFALICMSYFGVSANLMSLGAIDFGIVVDGAVIITEAALFALHYKFIGKKLSSTQMDKIISEEAGRVYGKAAFGVLIILVVFLPILSLSGIEGKMFKPMAQTVSFALLGALILSVTYVPVMASIILRKEVKKPWHVSERIMAFFHRMYKPALQMAIAAPKKIVGASAIVLVLTVFLFMRMGTEFLPNLEEGDLAMQMAIKPGSSLTESVETATKAEKILLESFPEIKHVVSKIGTAEIPTDPMAIEDADIMIILKPKKEWTSAATREGLVELMKEELEVVLGAQFEFTQPIQLRFNELLSGAKADIAIKIFGDDNAKLHQLAMQAARHIEKVEGAGDVKVEMTEGLPQATVKFNYEKMARFGVDVEQINTLVRTAFAGEVVGTIFEEEKRFDLVIRLDSAYRQKAKLDMLSVTTQAGLSVPLLNLVDIDYTDGPMQVSRENARRRIAIGINVRNRDMGSVVDDIKNTLNKNLKLPPGYTIAIGGQYENFIHASQRLRVAVPAALALIFILLIFAFGNAKNALIIFTAVPLSAVGGVLALLVRGMPFSISAGIGFIALFGVAVLNGIVLISHINYLQTMEDLPLHKIIAKAANERLRPVLITAAVAIMGFMPMALSNSAGAEVQKPLATVVIGGLLSATFLTLVVLPALFLLLHKTQKIGKVLPLVLLLITGNLAQAQTPVTRQQALDTAMQNNPEWLNANIELQQAAVRKQSAIEMSPLSVQYQQGQIDGPIRSDYTWSVQQDFGSLLAHVRRASEYNLREDLAAANLELRKRELKLEVNLLYENWLYAYERYTLANNELNKFKLLEQKLENRYTLGEISALEFNRSRNQLYQFYALAQRQEQEYLSATRQLKDVVLMQKIMIPAEEKMTPRLLMPDSTLAQMLLMPASLAVAAQEKTAKSEAGQFFPTINAGYYNLELAPATGLQAWSIGITVPLWFLPQSSRVKEARLEAAKLNNDFVALQKRYENALQQQWQAYNKFQERWQMSIKSAWQSAEDLQKQAESAFMNGEIDYLELSLNIETAVSLKFNYLENLFMMNQTALKIEFLVEN